MRMPQSRTIPELIHDMTESGSCVRDHRTWFKSEMSVGITAAECAEVEECLAEAETFMLKASCVLHQAEGVLLNVSSRWLANEAVGQDPRKEETSH